MAEYNFSSGFESEPLEKWRKPLVLALVRGSHQWVRDLNHWANGSVIDQDFAVVLSIDELLSRADGTDHLIIILVDSENRAVIAKLQAVPEIRDAHIIVVDASFSSEIKLPPGTHGISYPFTPDELGALIAGIDKEREFQTPPRESLARRSSLAESRIDPAPASTDPPVARVIAILGVGGSGSSTIAMAVAQSLAHSSKVVLADLCAEADLSMYHDIDRALGGLGELMAMARKATPRISQIRSYCLPAVGRNYFLLPGLRRQEESALWSQKHLEELLNALMSEFDYVVCDLDGSYRSSKTREALGEGSTTLATEVTLSRADAIALVMGNDLRSVHGGLRIYHRLLGDIAPHLPLALCVNRVTRKPLARSGHSDLNLAKLTQEIASGFATGESRWSDAAKQAPNEPTIIIVREERGLDNVHDAVRPLPPGLGAGVARWVEGLHGKVTSTPRQLEPRGIRIMPGDLSSSGVLKDSWW